MPDEILVQVFDRLSLRDLRAVNGVCRRWRRLSSDSVLWRRRFDYRWRVVAPSKMEMVLMSHTYKALFFQWLNWDMLEEKFREEDGPYNLRFEQLDEEWIEEEVEVAVLSEVEVPAGDEASPSEAADAVADVTDRVRKRNVSRQHSFREKKKRRVRRRRRLSVELAEMMMTRQGSRGVLTYGFGSLYSRRGGAGGAAVGGASSSTNPMIHGGASNPSNPAIGGEETGANGGTE